MLSKRNYSLVFVIFVYIAHAEQTVVLSHTCLTPVVKGGRLLEPMAVDVFLKFNKKSYENVKIISLCLFLY